MDKYQVIDWMLNFIVWFSLFEPIVELVIDKVKKKRASYIWWVRRILGVVGGMMAIFYNDPILALCGLGLIFVSVLVGVFALVGDGIHITKMEVADVPINDYE